MSYHFMNIGLDRAVDFPVHTLGPAGTSSEYASQFFNDWMNENYEKCPREIHLNDSYECARENIKDEKGLLIVANAYPNINEFYMDTKLKLLATFFYDTPLYGLVANKTLPDRPLYIASHPAPIPLIEELLPAGISVERIVKMSSTSAAAHAVAICEVDIALTTEVAARIHNLDFVSPTRPIHMLWSVFASHIR
ncbi:bacilysin biosynthesis protein BacA [Erwinia amylovora]|uniref:bacilysin biosynthesis protein BacA n=1 Tax=Erwinia amylovora TaxID=552 RepID=UPI001443F5C1|nr:bacilysin biosynthesis protein BacA [Erwinia amylovora]MCV6959817.1 bacilysin biosynthesis protein BacA [Erwinia amylovora]MCZ2717609.1 bacilysin biosynthesis protein BacA [Erwinia amylovora]MCZ2729059.1 bacilysin biosynthesis protein BacA [Erwinia amylovora]UZB34481.1 bacilysin biosynthesis protein BacA [Erwinia amylovora]UZB37808.1 bacilysin biosynthesis protein BacA [Erwinia amylovora]